jgi:hypothetical protein
MNKTKLMILLLASLTLGACSSDDNDVADSGYAVSTLNGAPMWQVDFTGDEVAPDWSAPDPSNYENWTIMLVEIEDALKPYASTNDMLAIFVNEDLRGLSSPAINLSEEENTNDDNKTLYILKAYGNETDQTMVDVRLSYYCSRLKQMFSLTTRTQFDLDKIYGLDDDFIPQFTFGSQKYPVVKEIGVSRFKNQVSGVMTPALGDVMAVFVGDECRGCYTLGAALLESADVMPVFAKNTGETFTLKYYQPATGKVYSFKEPVKI